MHDNGDFPPVWNPAPIKLVVVDRPEPDETEELQAMLAAINAAKDDETELITEQSNQ